MLVTVDWMSIFNTLKVIIWGLHVKKKKTSSNKWHVLKDGLMEGAEMPQEEGSLRNTKLTWTLRILNKSTFFSNTIIKVHLHA